MNQILYTGGKNKSKGANDTQKIIIFFVVFVIIFAICLIGVGINLLSKVKNENNTLGNTTGTPGQEPEKPVIVSNIKIELEAQTNSIKAVIKSNKKIKDISYWWDEEEPIEVESEVEFGTEYEMSIDSKPGTHQLTIKAIDENGYEKVLEQEVIGKVVDDTVPELVISTDRISKYIITAKDDQQIKKLVIILNGERKEVAVNEKEIRYEVDIPIGDSLLDVTAYNLNDLTNQKRAVIRNFRGQ